MISMIAMAAKPWPVWERERSIILVPSRTTHKAKSSDAAAQHKRARDASYGKATTSGGLRGCTSASPASISTTAAHTHGE